MAAEDPDPEPASASAPELPDEVVDEAERLTRLAREAVDPNERAAYRGERGRLLDDYGFAARVREEDEVLVLYPAEWVEDGTVRIDRVADTSRAVERSLAGPGEADDWAAVDEHNRAVADRVAAEYGEVHGANARAFAAFMSNHYARPVESAGGREVEEFLTEYFPRNAWPSDEQKAVVDTSVELALELAE